MTTFFYMRALCLESGKARIPSAHCVVVPGNPRLPPTSDGMNMLETGRLRPTGWLALTLWHDDGARI
jgi:hypothetical protein